MSNFIYSTGKRKSSIARVYLKEGSGIININNSLNYFGSFNKYNEIVKKTLSLLNLSDKIDLKIFVTGGGLNGQAEAIRHGINKALVLFDKDNEESDQSYKKVLKKMGFLTRDSRKVERKKVGRRKARKKEQYSKR